MSEIFIYQKEKQLDQVLFGPHFRLPHFGITSATIRQHLP